MAQVTSYRSSEQIGPCMSRTGQFPKTLLRTWISGCRCLGTCISRTYDLGQLGWFTAAGDQPGSRYIQEAARLAFRCAMQGLCTTNNVVWLHPARNEQEKGQEALNLHCCSGRYIECDRIPTIHGVESRKQYVPRYACIARGRAAV